MPRLFRIKGGHNLKPQYLNLMPNVEDEKRWVAEITGRDETFVLKRDFQPEASPGVWEMYDGWYQIHGQVEGITPFQKEYVRVLEGKMTRRLPFRYVVQQIPEIMAMEDQRKDRLKHQIGIVFEEIIEAAPYEQVRESIEMQRDDLDMVETSEQLLNGLKVLRQRKDSIIKQYNDAFGKWSDELG